MVYEYVSYSLTAYILLYHMITGLGNATPCYNGRALPLTSGVIAITIATIA